MMFLDSNRQGTPDADGFNQDRGHRDEDFDQRQKPQEQPAGPSGAQSESSGEEEETFEPDDDLPF